MTYYFLQVLLPILWVGESTDVIVSQNPSQVQLIPECIIIHVGHSSYYVIGLQRSRAELELFLSVNFNPKVTTPFLGSPNVSPLLRFTNDGSITRWSISGSASELPQLQIWRHSDGGLYERIQGSSTDFEVVNVNSVKTFVNQEISFRNGDILAVVSSSDRVVLGDILLNPDGYGASGYDPELEDVEIEATQGVIRISISIGKHTIADSAVPVQRSNIH